MKAFTVDIGGEEWTTNELEVALKRLKELEEESCCWFPITEKLPRCKQACIVFDDRHVRVAKWHSKEGYFVDGFNVLRVTHWRPLPKPPQERL